MDGSGVLSAPCQNLACPYYVRLLHLNEIPIPFGDKVQKVPELNLSDFSVLLQSEIAPPSSAATTGDDVTNITGPPSFDDASTANGNVPTPPCAISDGNTSGTSLETDVEGGSDSVSEMDWDSELGESRPKPRSLSLLTKVTKDKGKDKAHADPQTRSAPTGITMSPTALRFVNVSSRRGIHVKRPANSWLLYRAETAKRLSKMHFAQASKVLADMWRREPQSVKDHFAQRAAQLKEEHKGTFPDYKYTPRRK